MHCPFVSVQWTEALACSTLAASSSASFKLLQQLVAVGRVQVELNHNHLIRSLENHQETKSKTKSFSPLSTLLEGYLPKKWTKKWPWINPSLQLHKTLLIAQFTLVFCLVQLKNCESRALKSDFNPYACKVSVFVPASTLTSKFLVSFKRSF